MGEEGDKWLTDFGVDVNKFRAEGAASQDTGTTGLLKVVTGGFFRPDLQVLSPVRMPLPVPQNGELTIDLLVKNWDDAPKGTVMHWTATVDNKAIVAKVTNKAGEGYLTLRGITAGGVGVVKAAVVVKVDELEVPFEFPPIFLIVGTADASLDDSRLDDQGGPATSAQLDSDVTNLLIVWESAAKTGIAKHRVGVDGV